MENDYEILLDLAVTCKATNQLQEAEKYECLARYATEKVRARHKNLAKSRSSPRGAGICHCVWKG